jgi:6-phosphogluconolactonase (cycloisomerase 2 family)
MATIVTKNSSTASAVPTTSDLVQGELAVNVTDKRIFTENASTQIVELGTNPSTVTTATATVTGTLTANGTFASSNAVVTGGTINSTPIGATTPSTVRGTTVTATTGFVGGLTGNVTGNVTGNITGNVVGNVTGDLTGNVTASTGTSTVNNLVVNGTVDFSNTRLTDVAEPVAGSDAATKTYVDTSIAAVIDGAPAALDTLNELAAALNDDASFHTTVTNALTGKLALSGGTMTGQLSLGANKIVSVADPTLAQDVATKAYVDAADSTGLPLSGGTMSGAIAMGTNKITGLGDPTLAQDAATKAYTDSILGSATSAADSAAAAATSASNASTSASNAASSATTASNAVTSAELAATNAAASYDSFDDRYLGAKASDPTLDNDGDALIAGATYFNTSTDSMKVYSGSAWSDVAPVATTVTLSQVTDFPSQSGQSGKYLSTNGTTPTWETLTTDPTLGTLTKTFTSGESSTINLTSSVLAPVVSVTKEVPQSGVTNNNWDVNSTTENYTRLNSAYATTLDFSIGDISDSTLKTQFSSAIGGGCDGVFLGDSGNKLYISVNASSETIYEYSLSTAYDISTASLTNSFSVASQTTSPTCVSFDSSGQIMYVASNNNSTLYQYTLSTAWDVSTASYASKSFSVASQQTGTQEVLFSSDGTQMYTNVFGSVITQWSLGTAWDITTAVFAGNYNYSSQGSSSVALYFSPNGLEMYVGDYYTNSILKYELSTAWTISTSSYSGDSYTFADGNSLPVGLSFNADLSNMYIMDQLGAVFQYSLPRPLTLGTGSFASADVGKTIEANDGVFVLTATDGSFAETTAPISYDQVASGSWEMYGVVYNAADGDLQLSGYVNAYDLTGAFYDSVSFSVASQTTDPWSIAFNNEGSKMYVLGEGSSDAVYQYSLSSNFDVSTASYDSVSFSVASQTTAPMDIKFNNNGTKMYISRQSGIIYEYSLSTAFNISTASYNSNFLSTQSQESTLCGMCFNSAGTKLYATGEGTDAIYQYSLVTAFDISTATYDSVSFSISSQDSSPQNIVMTNDDSYLIVTGRASDTIYKYSLSTAGDLSTASLNSSFSVNSQEPTVQQAVFSSDGTKMFVVGYTNDTVYQYSTGSLYFPTGYQPVHTTASIDSTYWTDINSMTADQAAGNGNVYYAISTDDRTTWTVIDNTDGERDIVRNNAGTWQYNSNGTYASETWTNATTNTELAALAEAMENARGGYGVADISYVQNFTSNTADKRDVYVKPDGTKIFFLRYDNSRADVYSYTMTTPFDVSVMTFDGSFNIGQVGPTYDSTAFSISPDGNYLYVFSNSTRSVYRWNFGTAWDISTLSWSGLAFNATGQVASVASGIRFKTDGTKMYLADANNRVIYQYSLSTAWDNSTASYDSKSFSGFDANYYPTAYEFDNTGELLIATNSGGVVNKYSLSTAWDISTATATGETVTTTYGIQGMAYGDSGNKLYAVNGSTTPVYQYSSLGDSVNKMDKTQLDAVTDPNHIELGDDLDLSIIFNMTSGTTVPSSDGVAINYDANVLNKGAVLGTDYDFDAPAGDKARITALTAGNFKVRVV